MLPTIPRTLNRRVRVANNNEKWYLNSNKYWHATHALKNRVIVIVKLEVFQLFTISIRLGEDTKINHFYHLAKSVIRGNKKIQLVSGIVI